MQEENAIPSPLKSEALTSNEFNYAIFNLNWSYDE